jgi:transposase
MPTDQAPVRRDGRMPDEVWAHLPPRLPPRQLHPLGGHRPRVDDRNAREAMCFVRRTGCQGNALNPTDSCASGAAHRRCPEWAEAGVCLA